MDEISKKELRTIAFLTKSRNRRENFRAAKSVNSKQALAARQMRRNFGGAFGKEKAEVVAMCRPGTGL